MSAVVGFAGSRSLSFRFAPLVASAVKAVLASGRNVATGCAAGADEITVRACLELSHGPEVFAIGTESGEGFWRESMQPQLLTRCKTHHLAGGGLSLSLSARLHNRTVSLINFVADSGDNAAVVCFFASAYSKGTTLAARTAAARKLPVIAFACGITPEQLPALGRGHWQQLAPHGLWAKAYRWSVKQYSLDELSSTRLPFGKYQGLTFDDAPLSYLDWLSGQPWCDYGEFRTKLSKYLLHPVIQKELDETFPDRETESNGFTVVGTFDNSAFRNHGRPIFIDPEEEAAEERRQRFQGRKPQRYSEVGAFKVGFNLLCKIESARDGEDLAAAVREVTPALKAAMPERLLNALRDAYRATKQRLTVETLIPDNCYNALLLLEAVNEEPRLRNVAKEAAPDLLAVAQVLTDVLHVA